MPIKLNTASGGGVTLSAANTATDKTITVPADDGTMIYANSSGNVGIGTSSPVALLDVRGKLAISNGAASYWQLDRNDSDGSLQFLDGTTERMRIDSTGIISSVATYNNTTASAANAVFQSNGGFQRSTSALKYKQDIRNLESIDITQFRPVRYKSKCDGDDQTKDHFGIIADEVDAVGVKELVTYNADDEVEGFQYERLTVVLLKAIQEQQQMIETLQAKVAALEAQ